MPFLTGYCAYLDVENALNPLVAKSIGVNTDNLLISQPDSAENLLSMVDTLTKSGSIAVIVVDSVSSVIRKCLECPQLSWQEKSGYFPITALFLSLTPTRVALLPFFSV